MRKLLLAATLAGFAAGAAQADGPGTVMDQDVIIEDTAASADHGFLVLLSAMMIIFMTAGSVVK